LKEQEVNQAVMMREFLKEELKKQAEAEEEGIYELENTLAQQQAVKEENKESSE